MEDSRAKVEHVPLPFHRLLSRTQLLLFLINQKPGAVQTPYLPCLALGPVPPRQPASIHHDTLKLKSFTLTYSIGIQSLRWWVHTVGGSHTAIDSISVLQQPKGIV